MTTKVNADTSGGLKLTSDTSGTLELQSAGNTKLTVNSSGATIPTITGNVQIDGTGTDDFLVIKTTEASANSAPDVVLYRESSSPADDDFLGKFVFRGRNDNSQDVAYSQIVSQAVDVSDGTEDGRLYLQTIINGSPVNHIMLDHSGVTFAGGIVGVGSINSGQIGGRRNAIHNPNGAVNQRHGTAANTTMNTYAMDRWRSFGGGTGYGQSFLTKSDAGEGDGYYIRYQRPNGNSTTFATGIAQGLESVDSKHLAGKSVTLSFRARGGANWSPTSGSTAFRVVGGEGTDQSPVGMTTAENAFVVTAEIPQGGGFVTYSGTGTIPADKTQIAIQIAWTWTGTAGANDYIDIRNLQLEIGNTASQFEQLSYGEELQRCQRYCSVYDSAQNSIMPVSTAQVDSANRPEYMLYYPTKRAAPSITVTGATNMKVLTAANTGIAMASFAGALVGTTFTGANLFFTVSSGVSVNDLSGICLELIVFQNSGSITVDAEL